MAKSRGAPNGNLNAMKHGERSKNWRKLTQQRKYKKHPGRGGARPGAGAPKQNLSALKTGKHSKIIAGMVDTHPTIKALRLNKDRAREYLVGQLKS